MRWSIGLRLWGEFRQTLVLRVRQRGRQVRSAKKMVRGYLRSVCVASVGISRSPGAAAARRQSLRGSALPGRRTCSESLASVCTTPQETVTKNAKRHRSNQTSVAVARNVMGRILENVVNLCAVVDFSRRVLFGHTNKVTRLGAFRRHTFLGSSRPAVYINGSIMHSGIPL